MIVSHHLTKRYGTTVAVDDLTFKVTPGVVTGFLGPNGSGKSTTMRMIMGLDLPDSGSATVNGVPYEDLRWPLREVGALLDAKAFHPGRSARDHLRWLAQTNDIPAARIDEVLDLVGLTAVAGQAGREVLPRHGAAPRHRRRAAGRPGRAALRRARQRARPRGHPLGPPPAARPGRTGPDGPRLEPPHHRDVADGRAAGGDRARQPDRGDERRRVHRRRTRRSRSGSSPPPRSASSARCTVSGPAPPWRTASSSSPGCPRRPSASWPPLSPSRCTSSAPCGRRSRTPSWSSPVTPSSTAAPPSPRHPSLPDLAPPKGHAMTIAATTACAAAAPGRSPPGRRRRVDQGHLAALDQVGTARHRRRHPLGRRVLGPQRHPPPGPLVPGVRPDQPVPDGPGPRLVGHRSPRDPGHHRRVRDGHHPFVAGRDAAAPGAARRQGRRRRPAGAGRGRGAQLRLVPRSAGPCCRAAARPRPRSGNRACCGRSWRRAPTSRSSPCSGSASAPSSATPLGPSPPSWGRRCCCPSSSNTATAVPAASRPK